VTAGNNMTMKCTLKGDFVGYLQSGGRQVRVNLKDVLYVPVNLLSVTQCLRYPGVTFCGDSEGLGLCFVGKYYKFEKELIHGNGKLYAADIKPIKSQQKQ
jgi:hypothetical protein